jgi:hypothetical protein
MKRLLSSLLYGAALRLHKMSLMRLSLRVDAGRQFWMRAE